MFAFEMLNVVGSTYRELFLRYVVKLSYESRLLGESLTITFSRFMSRTSHQKGVIIRHFRCRIEIYELIKDRDTDNSILVRNPWYQYQKKHKASVHGIEIAQAPDAIFSGR